MKQSLSSADSWRSLTVLTAWAFCGLSLVVVPQVGFAQAIAPSPQETSAPSSPPEINSQALFPIWVDGKFGFIDAAGAIVIAPQFDSVLSFSEPGELPNGLQLAPVQVGFQWGYIDTTGAIVIEPQFDGTGSFSEGLAVVAIAGRTGYINSSGAIAIPIERDPVLFADMETFSEGLVVIRQGELYGYMNAQGEIAIAPQFELAGPFSEGLAWVVVDGKVGYIDQTGTMVIQPQFSPALLFPAGNFSEGLAWVMSNGRIGYISPTGQFAIPPQFEFGTAADFSEGLAAAALYETSLQGYIDRTGTFVIPPQFSLAGAFNEGLAPVFEDFPNTQNGTQAMYINPAGQVILRPQAQHLGNFIHGVAWISGTEGSGYIDRTGQWIWQLGN